MTNEKLTELTSNVKALRKELTAATAGVVAQSKANYREYAHEFVGDNQYVGYWDRFYQYDGTRYVELRPTLLSKRVRRLLMSNGYPCSNQAVSNITECLIASKTIANEASYPRMPFYYDPTHAENEEAFPKNVIAFTNGLLDVDAWLAGKAVGDCLLPHTPHWVSTVCLPYAFNPAALCPLWEEKLREVFDNDPVRVALLQEWFGYCMTTDTSYQKLLMKVGPPRAFKGVSDRVLEAVVGSENTTGFYLHALANTFGARWLVNKQVAFVEEVNFDSHDAKGRILGTLNSIVGEAGQSVERKGDNATPTIILPTRFSISCNELPNFHDTSGALAARLLILPFDKSFAGREDRGLLTKLLAELSGIANWGLEGLRRLRDNGRFSEPERGRQELNQFRRTTDAFGFLQDCLWVERGIDPGNLDGVRIVEGPLSITRPELIGAYTDWSIENGLTPDKSWIVRRMRVILPKLTESRGRRSGERERVYHGIGLATG